MTMTIKELAEELGVSKTAINKKINANQKRKHFSKIGNRFVIDSQGQELIRSMFEGENENYRKPKNENITQTQVSDVSDLVSVLKDRVAFTEKQVDEKDKQIETLQKLLDQQQQLTLQANIKIKELETTLTETDVVETETKQSEQEEEPIKKSFWQRLFNN